MSSHVLCTVSFDSTDTPMQINCTWKCEWTSDATTQHLKLKAIEVEDYEEVVAEFGVQNQPPEPKISMTSGDQTAYENETLTLTVPPGDTAQVQFSASRSTDPDGSITGYRWTINETEVSTSSDFSRDLGVGMYQIALTVTDNQGAQGSAGASVVVTEQAPLDLYEKDQLTMDQH